jgi:hypothetical protein
MKRIDTTQIVSPTSKQPFTGRSLAFLQDYNEEDKAAFIKALITSNLGSYSLTVPYVISGCVVSDAGKDVTAGALFYGGKYYETTAVNGATNVARFILTQTQDATADPLIFSDSVSKTVHNIFKYIPTDVASGGDFTSAALVSAYGSSKITSQIESVNQNTTSTSYIDLTASTYTTPNDGITRTWLIQGKTNVRFSGSTGDGGKLQILVDGVSEDISESYLDVLAVNVDLYLGVCTCITVMSVPPNKVIKLQIASTNGGGIDFNNNKFIIVEI